MELDKPLHLVEQGAVYDGRNAVLITNIGEGVDPAIFLVCQNTAQAVLVEGIAARGT